MQAHSNAFKVDTSKQQLFDVYAAYKGLSYRDAIEENRTSLMPEQKPERKTAEDYIPQGVVDFEKVSEPRGFIR